MLVIILSVFAMCWLPFQIAILYSEYRSDKRQQVCVVHTKWELQGLVHTDCEHVNTSVVVSLRHHVFQEPQRQETAD